MIEQFVYSWKVKKKHVRIDSNALKKPVIE